MCVCAENRLSEEEIERLKGEIDIEKALNECKWHVKVTRNIESCHIMKFRSSAIFPAVISVVVVRLCSAGRTV